MTRKDFQLIAETLNYHIKDKSKCFDNPDDVMGIINSFTNALAETNPLFDEVRFVKACLAK